ncbi:hypothetical protein [Pedobacter alluvionis]|uniref:Uncharacterized protein n=1 Tax=Pedobacter alluvionis TaxID=475253 RepID=A0A497Y451_9SPHI|nr:hypothetical protein [Pedobacter alluvionis]RLJ76645.1 hypothetical protein BCL90_1688 [Pedobacter alluvionis]TFB34076.1 hypothetical protein E3V97_08545 [Pedobacter alluvionis]
MNEENKSVDYKRWSLLSDDNEPNVKEEVIDAPQTNILHDLAFKKSNASRIYRSESLSLMRIDDIIVSKSSTMTDFKLTVQDAGAHSVVKIEILKSHLDNNIEELNSFNDLLYKIASVKDNIVLKLDIYGSIQNLLNREELKEKWLAVRSDLLNDRKFLMFKPEEQELILKGGDDEYLSDFDLVEFLNRGYTIYVMMFIGYWKEYKAKQTYSLNRKFKNSTLFKDQIIPLDFEVKLKRYHNETGVSELEMQGIEPDDINIDNLRKVYKEAYPFAKFDMEEYSYDFEATYDIENESGLVKKMNATVFEKAGSIEMFMDCNIKELKDEKSNIAE